jgi:glycine hydroxymethyltransferase
MHEETAGNIIGAQRRHNEWISDEVIDEIGSKGAISQTAWDTIASNREMHGDYAEGPRGDRYYEGAVHIDEIDKRTEDSAKKVFECNFVDIRPISGNIANDCVFGRHIKPGDLVITNSIPAGGHISHNDIGSIGYYTQNIIHFPLEMGANGNPGYRIDVEKTIELIYKERPKFVILGKSLILFPEPVGSLRPTCLRLTLQSMAEAGRWQGN